MFQWRRVTNLQFNWQVGTFWMHAIPAGNTYVRTHFRWGFIGDTSTAIDLQGPPQNLLTMGLVTTIGNGTESVPNARTASGDASPPTQRWLYWETRAPVIRALDMAGNVAIWEPSPSTEETDTKGQVLATGLPVGDTLNLWASWAAPAAWDPSGSVQVWVSASMLVKVP